MQMVFTREIRDKIEWQHILEEEVAQVVDHCERTGKKVIDPATGRFTGHKTLGLMTCWVEYATEGDVAIIYNVYSHRMTIEDNPQG